LVFDLAALIDVQAYSDEIVKRGIMMKIHSFGFIKDDLQLNVKSDIVRLKLVPDDWQHFILQQLEKLKDNYGNK
jgi:hypothetical protein